MKIRLPNKKFNLVEPMFNGYECEFSIRRNKISMQCTNSNSACIGYVQSDQKCYLNYYKNSLLLASSKYKLPGPLFSEFFVEDVKNATEFEGAVRDSVIRVFNYLKCLLSFEIDLSVPVVHNYTLDYLGMCNYNEILFDLRCCYDYDDCCCNKLGVCGVVNLENSSTQTLEVFATNGMFATIPIEYSSERILACMNEPDEELMTEVLNYLVAYEKGIIEFIDDTYQRFVAIPATKSAAKTM